MNSKIKKTLLVLPFFVFSENSEDKRAEIMKDYQASKLAFGGSAYASYLISAGESFLAGPLLGVMYDSDKKSNVLLGAQIKMAFASNHITGVRFIAGALLGYKSKNVEVSKDFNEDLVTKINGSSNGLFKGVIALLAADTCYYFSVGAYVKWSESSRFSRSSSAGIAIVPNMEVTDSVEVGSIFFAGYNSAMDYEKLTDEQKKYVKHNLLAELFNNRSDDVIKAFNITKENINKIKNGQTYESFKGSFKNLDKVFSELFNNDNSNTADDDASSDIENSSN